MHVIYIEYKWLPECIRGAKPMPADHSAQAAQAAHLFSIAANGGVMAAPPSPMIRASGHHHNGPLQHQQGLNPTGSQLSVGTPSAPHLTYQTPPPGIAHHQKVPSSLTHLFFILCFTLQCSDTLQLMDDCFEMTVCSVRHRQFTAPVYPVL